MISNFCNLDVIMRAPQQRQMKKPFGMGRGSRSFQSAPLNLVLAIILIPTSKHEPLTTLKCPGHSSWTAPPSSPLFLLSPSPLALPLLSPSLSSSPPPPSPLSLLSPLPPLPLPSPSSPLSPSLPSPLPLPPPPPPSPIMLGQAQ